MAEIKVKVRDSNKAMMMSLVVGAEDITRPLHPRERNLTPGITRRPAPLEVYDKLRVGGRVHAVVRWRTSSKIHFHQSHRIHINNNILPIIMSSNRMAGSIEKRAGADLGPAPIIECSSYSRALRTRSLIRRASG